LTEHLHPFPSFASALQGVGISLDSNMGFSSRWWGLWLLGALGLLADLVLPVVRGRATPSQRRSAHLALALLLAYGISVGIAR
jgi:hypothetical protein